MCSLLTTLKFNGLLPDNGNQEMIERLGNGCPLLQIIPELKYNGGGYDLRTLTLFGNISMYICR
jgi:hypothetical protein